MAGPIGREPRGSRLVVQPGQVLGTGVDQQPPAWPVMFPDQRHRRLERPSPCRPAVVRRLKPAYQLAGKARIQ